MEPKVRVRSFAILGALIGVTACTDSATAPATKRPTLLRDVASASARRPTRFANNIKYRDKGQQNAKGRAGASGATLEARALLDRDGTTTLDVSTGEIDGAAGAGLLNKIQLKLFAPDGTQQTAINYNNLSTPAYQVTLAGRTRGSKIQVQGSIAVSDGKKIDVVTLSETVKLRPDISVDRITVPARSQIATPVSISAVVSENNGDVGAHADCVLAVDGVEVGRAHGIWVDAGRSVSCLFTQLFRTTGTRQLTVSAVSVSPGDWNASNNSVTRAIDVVLPPNEFTWNGYYVGITNWSGISLSQGYWTTSAGERADYSIYQDIHHSDSWVAHVGAYVAPVTGSFTFVFHDEIDGKPLNDFESSSLITQDPFISESTYEDPVLGTVHAQASCVQAYRLVPGVFEGNPVEFAPAWFTICTTLRSGPSGPLPDISFTDFNYTAGAADVSYYGETYLNYDPGPNYDPSYANTFTFNGETSYAYGTLGFGRDYRFMLSISGADQTRTASGTIHLDEPRVYRNVEAYHCWDSGDATFFSHSCFSGDYVQTGIQGFGEGTPD